MKIYEIEIKDYSKYIVVADNTAQACDKLKKYLDAKDLHFPAAREAKVIKVLADAVDDKYPEIYEISKYI